MSPGSVGGAAGGPPPPRFEPPMMEPPNDTNRWSGRFRTMARVLMRRPAVPITAAGVLIYYIYKDEIRQYSREKLVKMANKNEFILTVENLNWRYDTYATILSRSMRTRPPPKGFEFARAIAGQVSLTWPSFIIPATVVSCIFVQIEELTPEQQEAIKAASALLKASMTQLELKRIGIQEFSITKASSNPAEDLALIDRRATVLKEIMLKEVDVETEYMSAIRSILTKPQWVSIRTISEPERFELSKLST
jgi:hypothetical protein